ncbi:toxic anion resistance protein [Nitratiruptor sp. YY09-18]|uniref:toxic anion resistance protein n=1 Tax=Nitratiruptor sp. YY09-18 TaxID=2724901 RepID=UPI001914F00C|nr:toxic anion resistance protein [Nitratiruptor sp. YY09-18]BCD67890.1 hypothetical protein NitYY0918_C0797 [Nitratiruptor sp. YY09-18]
MQKEIKEKIEHEISKQDSSILPPLEESEQKIIEELKKSLDFTNRNAVITFGVEAQEKLDEISSSMIEGVKNKDLEEAGETLNKMVLTLRGFNVENLKDEELPWWKKLLGFTSPIVETLQQYEEVKDQIELIANDLEKHKAKLMQDMVALEKLYEANLDYFRKLELYIKAGEEKIKELDEKIIPEFEKKAHEGELIDAQNLREIKEFRDELERRVHDLKLSRQVAMQALPSIRLIQENDKALINKITSTLVNTIPLWRNQLAQVVTVYRSRGAAKSLKASADLTNELLEKNAEALKMANKEVKEQVERGVFDIESIKKANQTLIDTLHESMQIADEGKKQRELAEKELHKLESELKNALIEMKRKKEASNGTL